MLRLYKYDYYKSTLDFLTFMNYDLGLVLENIGDIKELQYFWTSKFDALNPSPRPIYRRIPVLSKGFKKSCDSSLDSFKGILIELWLFNHVVTTWKSCDLQSSHFKEFLRELWLLYHVATMLKSCDFRVYHFEDVGLFDHVVTIFLPFGHAFRRVITLWQCPNHVEMSKSC